jgi:Cu-Zn family superoxide dismutase
MFLARYRKSCESRVIQSREERFVRKGRVVLFGLLGALLLALGAGVATAQSGGTATAALEDTDGNPVGDATFTEGPDGVTINVNVRQGIEPGEHGIHIHETGKISPDFEAAGKHFNPSSAKHGFDNPEGPHAGDLEDIVVNPDGTANYTTTSDRITLSKGPNSILDSDGSALVIHDKADDYQTDPSGESGDRIAAGVIKESSSGESTTPAGKTSLPKSGGTDILLPTALGVAAVMVLGIDLLLRRLRRA